MKIWQRLLLFVVVFIGVSILPWWLSVIVLAGLTVYIRFYFEVIFFGFLFDILYSNQHVGIISALVFLLIVEFVRTRVRV